MRRYVLPRSPDEEAGDLWQRRSSDVAGHLSKPLGDMTSLDCCMLQPTAPSYDFVVLPLYLKFQITAGAVNPTILLP